MKINLGRKKIDVDVQRVGSLGKFRGLMFRRRNCNNLLFEFGEGRGRSIHSYFVFFPFLAVWLDGKNNVVEHKIVKPFRLRVGCRKEFRKLVEIPLNGNNQKVLEKFVV